MMRSLARSTRLLLFAAMIATLIGGALPGYGNAQEATPAADCVSTTPEENEELARFYWQEVVWGQQGKVAEVVSPDVVNHWGHGIESTGFDAFSETFATILSAFPDMSYTVNLVAAQDDLVASAWTGTGTQSGEWAGIAPTGNTVTMNGIAIFRVACGQIAETWVEANNLGLLAQLGSPDVPAFLADAAAPEATPEAAGAASTPCAGDSPEANLALVERWTTDVWVGQELAVLDEIASPDIVHHGAAFPDSHGVEAVKEGIQSQLAVFPDMDLVVDQAFADDHLVVVRWSGTGTDEGGFLGNPPSGQETAMSGINIYQVHCGQIVESWSEINGLGMLRQIQEAEASATPAA